MNTKVASCDMISRSKFKGQGHNVTLCIRLKLQ